MTDLTELEARVARDLELLDYPARTWVPPRRHANAPVLDVLIVGAGQGGLATAFGLKRARVDNILVVDRQPAGQEGPWVTFARMITLRTPKHVTGPDLGIPSLTPRAWYEAVYGAQAWRTLDKIPREVWQDYLNWYRRVLDLPVRNETAVTRIDPIVSETAGDIFAVTVEQAGHRETLFARKIVLATGIDGSGRWFVPTYVRDNLPRERWAHTSETIDFTRLAGKRVGVLGAGASAFDNAATALEHGAGEVRLFVRRREIPKINPYRWMEFTGFLDHFAALDDLRRWRMMRHIYDMNQPPPQDTFLRARRHDNFHLHTGTPWLDARMEGEMVAVETPDGARHLDFLIIGTGFVIDLNLRPELAGFANHIALWRDRFTPPSGEESTVLSSYPYLGPAFQFQEREPGSAPFLGNLHNFTFGATPSMGLSGASISGMKFGVPRLVRGLCRDLFVADADIHQQSLEDYDVPELRMDEWAA